MRESSGGARGDEGSLCWGPVAWEEAEQRAREGELGAGATQGWRQKLRLRLGSLGLELGASTHGRRSRSWLRLSRERRSRAEAKGSRLKAWSRSGVRVGSEQDSMAEGARMAKGAKAEESQSRVRRCMHGHAEHMHVRGSSHGQERWSRDPPRPRPSRAVQSQGGSEVEMGLSWIRGWALLVLRALLQEKEPAKGE